MDIFTAQANRGVLVGAFLDITLARWMDHSQDVIDTIPDELEPIIVSVIESLQATDDPDNPAQDDARGNYLQQIASLSDDALAWLVNTYGEMPELLA